MEWLLVLAPLVGGSISGFIAGDLKNAPRPKQSPPGWVFGPVWTVLYLMMGFAASMIFKQTGRVPMIFWIQLALNLIWSPVYVKNQKAALAIIAALWVSILLTIIEFQRIDPIASRLLYPYLIWVSYASFLNKNVVTF